MLFIIYLSYIFLIRSLLEAREEIQKYFLCFFVQMKSLEFAFETNWPLVASQILSHKKDWGIKKEENIVTVLYQNVDPPIKFFICIQSFSKNTIRTSFRNEFESYVGLINDFWTPQPQDWVSTNIGTCNGRFHIFCEFWIFAMPLQMPFSNRRLVFPSRKTFVFSSQIWVFSFSELHFLFLELPKITLEVAPWTYWSHHKPSKNIFW